MPISVDERMRQWDDFAEPYARLAQRCPEDMLDALAALAGNRPAIELGAGAGRIAIPLALRGVPVTAAEFSPRMIRHLREAAAREAVSNLEILQCNFASLPADKRYGLAYCIDNGFFALCSEEEQLRCFRAVADVLDEDGFFVIEAAAPTPAQLDAGARIVYAAPCSTIVERFKRDGASTISLIAEITTNDAGENTQAARFWTLAHYYVPAAKFDDYAGRSAMTLHARWSDWSGAPYDGNPWRHISVWRRDIPREAR
jgi:ubiquinone/menaquinone biosynthesis C-methylase UbiE